jgi:prophage DNA circulation protein
MRYVAQIDKYRVNIEPPEETRPKDITEHSFPFRNGAILDDMGEKARSFKLKVWLLPRPESPDGRANFDDDYPAFVDYILGNRKLTFVHPQLGAIKGRVRSVTHAHDDAGKSAAIDFEFVEETLDEFPAYVAVAIVPRLEDLFKQAQLSQMDAFSALVTNTLGSGAPSFLSKAFDFTQSIESQIDNATGPIRDFAQRIDAGIRTFESAMATIEQPANSAIALMDYGTSLPGRVIGTVSRCIERYAEAVGAVVSAPEKFCSNFFDAVDKLKDSLSDFTLQTDMAALSVGSIYLGKTLASDENRRDTVRALELAPAFNLTGKVISTNEFERIATIQDLEYSAYVYRVRAQQTIDAARAENADINTAYDFSFINTACLEIQRYIDLIKLDRDKISVVDVDPWVPLVTLCARRGIPYRRATRIMANNPQISNPTFASGQVLLYE